MEINRQKAKELIAETLLTNSNCNLPELTVDFPYYDYQEEIFDFLEEGKLKELPQETLSKIEKREWFTIEFNLAFRPIYKEYFIFSFHHVTNQYLEKRLKDLGIEMKVIGDVEPTGKCPCCQYYSIDFGEDGGWDICSVCFWENGGNSPNRMTLEEAQQNFEKYGAMSQSALSSIDPEGKIKFRREQNDI